MKKMLSILTVLSVALTAVCSPTRSMLGAQRSINGASSSPVPAEYRVVRSLKIVSGSPWFQTGVYNNADWSARVRFWIPEIVPNNSYGVIGAPTVNGSGWGYGIVYYGPFIFLLHGDKYSVTRDAYVVGENEFACTVSAATATGEANGATLTSISSTLGFSGTEICLIQFGGNVRFLGAEIGETVIYQGGAEVVHLYPCVRISDSVPCFYDAVQKVERLNVGTGTVTPVEF